MCKFFLLIEDAQLKKAKSLDSKTARDCWEELFTDRYVRPVLEDLDNILNENMKKIALSSSDGKSLSYKFYLFSLNCNFYFRCDRFVVKWHTLIP